MFGSLLLALSFQIGPFYEQRPDLAALRPLWSTEGETDDVLWPVFTSHRDWWRFCWFTQYQRHGDGTYQFEMLPIWFNGTEKDGSGYWGLWPLYGHHPHALLMYDVDFALWPLWMRYSMPRPGERRMMRTNAVMFPLAHWRDDGSWGLWPLYGQNHQRESDHRYVLWPVATWANYREDRDTAGAGYSWMFWPLCGAVSRERESQYLFIPPFFSWAETRSPIWAKRGNSAPEVRLRCPWPLFEYERRYNRSRISVMPFYEHDVAYDYGSGEPKSEVTRFGWKLVELYGHETRVFPFYVNGERYFRLWPFWESRTADDGTACGRALSLFPIRWVDSIDRNWAKFWTFYECERNPIETHHSLFWGIVRWSTDND